MECKESKEGKKVSAAELFARWKEAKLPVASSCLPLKKWSFSLIEPGRAFRDVESTVAKKLKLQHGLWLEIFIQRW